jgi:hypothetical protein
MLREEMLDAVLRPIHNSWVTETHRFLDPALDPGADFWTRWGAIRYFWMSRPVRGIWSNSWGSGAPRSSWPRAASGVTRFRLERPI